MAGKRPKPESPSQAKRWQAVCTLAEKAGLCSRCASQFAWGVQGGVGGFSSVHPPCAACVVVMLGWPVVRPNSWRSPSGVLSEPASWSGQTLTRRTASPVGVPDRESDG